SGKAVFFPHGMDQMFQNPGDALSPGWGGLAARAVIETPEGKKRYIARLKEMTAKYFVLTDWYKRIDEMTARAKEALETVQKGAGQGLENEVRAYKDRLKQRADYLARELPKMK